MNDLKRFYVVSVGSNINNTVDIGEYLYYCDAYDFILRNKQNYFVMVLKKIIKVNDVIINECKLEVFL